MPALEVENLRKTFGRRVALDVDGLRVERGDMVALIGPSGAGKSTLLRHVAGLVAGDTGRGEVRLDGQVVQARGRIAGRIRELRAQTGFIFQQFNLVGRLSLLENVLIGMLARLPVHRRLLRWFTHDEKVRAMQALHFVGMSDYAGQRASTLSGGQQQRGAIARAIVQGARLLLADEPIASLDPASAKLVMQTLRRMNREAGVTVIVSLHQIDYAQNYCDRVVAMKDGRVKCDCAAGQLNLDRLRLIYGPTYDALAPRPEPAEGAQRRGVVLADVQAEATAGI